MVKIIKRFVNVLAIIGTLIGVVIAFSSIDQPYGPTLLQIGECMLGGYMFIAGINYIMFGNPVVWNDI